jgi:hypothetical protein
LIRDVDAMKEMGEPSAGQRAVHTTVPLRPFFYELPSAAFGTAGIVWQAVSEMPKVYRTLLLNERIPRQ